MKGSPPCLDSSPMTVQSTRTEMCEQPRGHHDITPKRLTTLYPLSLVTCRLGSFPEPIGKSHFITTISISHSPKSIKDRPYKALVCPHVLELICSCISKISQPWKRYSGKLTWDKQNAQGLTVQVNDHIFGIVN